MFNIPANLFRIIHSMYFQMALMISDEFPSTCGVKQGDVLSSPLLFNLFLNDLVKSLDSSECDPLVIGDLTINCLLYANEPRQANLCLRAFRHDKF